MYFSSFPRRFCFSPYFLMKIVLSFLLLKNILLIFYPSRSSSFSIFFIPFFSFLQTLFLSITRSLPYAVLIPASWSTVQAITTTSLSDILVLRSDNAGSSKWKRNMRLELVAFEDTGSNSDSIELPSLKIWIFEYFENIYIWNQKNNKHPISHILHSTISSTLLKVTYCARIDFRSTLSSSWKFALQTCCSPSHKYMILNASKIRK